MFTIITDMNLIREVPKKSTKITELLVLHEIINNLEFRNVRKVIMLSVPSK